MRGRKITRAKCEWEVNFDIDYPIEHYNLEWRRNNIELKKSKDDKIKGNVFIETDCFDETAKKEAKEIMHGLLDSYFVLNDVYLKIKNVHVILKEVIQNNKRAPVLTHLSIKLSGTPFYDIISLVNLDNSLDFSKKIQGHVESDRIKKVLKWLRRGLDDPDKIDKFISYWISFNAFYNFYKGKYESDKFKELLKNLTDDQISKEIINNNIYHVNTLKASTISKKNTMLNKKLEKCLINSQYKEALKYVVECIYKARNDVVHGSEELIQQNERLIDSCIPILKVVIRECLINFIK